MSRIKRTYKYRCYPTDEQKGILARTFGCCPYIYNWALHLKSQTYRQTCKQKHGEQAATYTAAAFTWKDGTLTLAKMQVPLDIRFSRPLPEGAKPSSVTLTRDCAGRYFASILVEEEIKQLPASQARIGIDLGLSSMLISSQGEKVGNPRFMARDAQKLARAQRRHARKHKGSRNREKARRRVAEIHASIRDKRRD